ncbi:MAG: SDR family oxidoreductase [Rhodothermales bacterium]
MPSSASRIVAITGAGNGIGRLLALRFAERGDHVVGLDIDPGALAEVSGELGEAFTAIQMDLSDVDSIREGFAVVSSEVGPVDILINNAGIVSGKYLLDYSAKDIRRTMAVNVEAHFHTVRAVLPDMIRRGSGHIVTVASAGGLSATARLSAYSASKFAAVGFDEALRLEMRRLGHPIDTTLVAPFYIDTGMFDGVKTRVAFLLPILKPDYAVRRIMKAIDRKKRRLIMPRFVYITFPLRLLPVPVYDWLADLFGVTRTMDEFIGHD